MVSSFSTTTKSTKHRNFITMLEQERLYSTRQLCINDERKNLARMNYLI